MTNKIIFALGGIAGEAICQFRKNHPDAKVCILDMDAADCQQYCNEGVVHAFLGDHRPFPVILQEIAKWNPELAITGMELRPEIYTSAGGRRLVGRAYFLYAMLIGKLQPALDVIRQAIAGDQVNGLDITVVTSLCGGTGSGMLLQFVLWLRQTLRRNVPYSVGIRGVFLMTDLLQGVAQDPNVWQQMCANELAAIKELDLVSRVYAADPSVKQANLTLDGLFDSAKDFGSGKKLFNNIYLAGGSEAVRAAQLYNGGLCNYVAQVLEVLTQSQTVAGSEDGVLNNTIWKSIGAAGAVYDGRAHVPAYAAYLADEMLADPWFSIEQRMIHRMEQTKERQNDKVVYMQQYRQIAQENPTTALAEQLPAADERIEALFEQINNLLQEQVLPEIGTKLCYDLSDSEPAGSAALVQDADTLFRQMDQGMQAFAGLAHRYGVQIVDRFLRGTPYENNTLDETVLFSSNGDAEHPALTRYLLCGYILKIEEKLYQCNVHQAEKEARECLNAAFLFDNPRTEAVESSAGELMRTKPFFCSMDKFRQEHFQRVCRQMQERVDRWQEQCLLEQIYKNLLTKLHVLEEKYKKIFWHLIDVRNILCDHKICRDAGACISVGTAAGDQSAMLQQLRAEFQYPLQEIYSMFRQWEHPTAYLMPDRGYRVDVQQLASRLHRIVGTALWQQCGHIFERDVCGAIYDHIRKNRPQANADGEFIDVLRRLNGCAEPTRRSIGAMHRFVMCRSGLETQYPFLGTFCAVEPCRQMSKTAVVFACIFKDFTTADVLHFVDESTKTFYQQLCAMPMSVTAPHIDSRWQEKLSGDL